jgi:hypothetical protein
MHGEGRDCGAGLADTKLASLVVGKRRSAVELFVDVDECFVDVFDLCR